MKHKQIYTARIYSAILLISILCIVLSTIIQSEKRQYALHQATFCSAITGANGCEAVQTSAYGKIFGLDNPIYGIVGFTLLGILSFVLIKKGYNILKYLTITGGIIAGIVAAIFLYLQTFVLHTYCIFCVFVDISSLILLGISIYLLYDSIKHK